MTKKEHQRKIGRIIKVVEDRDILLRKAGRRAEDLQNAQSTKSKRKKRK
jgi:hypothetical protein